MSKEKKTLLSEAQITKFMKLANLTALTPGFVSGLSGLGERRRSSDGKKDGSHGRGRHPEDLEESDIGEAMYRDEEEEGLEGEEVEMDLPPGEEEVDLPLPEEEPELDMGTEPEVPLAGGQTVSVDDFLTALETALEDVMGDEVEISQEPEEEEELEDEPEGEVELADIGPEEEVEEEEEMLESVDVAALVDRITSRVAQRLVGEALVNKK